MVVKMKNIYANEGYQLFTGVRKMVGANNMICGIFGFLKENQLKKFLESVIADYDLEGIDMDNYQFGIASEILKHITENDLVDHYQEVWEYDNRLGKLANDLIKCWELDDTEIRK